MKKGLDDATRFAYLFHFLPPFYLKVIIIPIRSWHIGVYISIAPGYAFTIRRVRCGTHFSLL
jgi:hypothetical protein